MQPVQMQNNMPQGDQDEQGVQGSVAPEGDAAPGQPAHGQPQRDDSLAGVGVDIVEIARIERILQRRPRFAQRVYTPAEQAYCEAKPNRAVHYALLFAAKEAVLKALGTGFRGMGITDVEVARNRNGRPVVVLSGKAAHEAQRQGIREVHLSLSYTHTTGVASAVAVRDQHIPAKRTGDAAALALDGQFKSMRALLDDIDAGLDQPGHGVQAGAGDAGQGVAVQGQVVDGEEAVPDD